MTSDEGDPILRMLSRLPAATPDPRRAARGLERCHSAASRRERRRRVTKRGLEVVLVGGFSLVYFLGLVHDVLRWKGML